MLPGKARARTAESAAAGQVVGVHFAVWCFFWGGKRFAGLTRGAVKNLRGIGVTGLCIRLPQKSGARECVYFNNVVSVAADLEKGDAKACLRATSRRSSLSVFMRPSARTGAPARARRASAGSSGVRAFCVIVLELCGESIRHRIM